ncbi:hypothetical protein F4809DRAFT_32231 [Biscogniauxia mediterranea]|nr:hypothetical protein F4809DRAFT_32231 [Biscogniauxia mediterranea]
MWFWVCLVQFFTGISAMLSDTRTCFALARDAVLGYHYHCIVLAKEIILSNNRTPWKMNRYTETPLYSVWSVVGFCCLLNFIALGSVQTISGIYGVTAPVIDLSYIAIIAARLYYEKELPVEKGPFRLGRWQKPINIIAIIWVTFISVVLFFPPSYPVTALNMIHCFFFTIAWWHVQGKGRAKFIAHSQ